MSKTITITSAALSIVTCIILLCNFSGCTAEQIQNADDTVKAIADQAPAIAPIALAAGTVVSAVNPNLSWPIWSVLITDILSAIAVIVTEIRKQLAVQSKG